MNQQTIDQSINQQLINVSQLIASELECIRSKQSDMRRDFGDQFEDVNNKLSIISDKLNRVFGTDRMRDLAAALEISGCRKLVQMYSKEVTRSLKFKNSLGVIEEIDLYVKLDNGQHVIGECTLSLSEKKKAERCFEKAVELAIEKEKSAKKIDKVTMYIFTARIDESVESDIREYAKEKNIKLFVVTDLIKDD